MNHKSRHVDWLKLPDELLYLINGKLSQTKDSIRFGAVCRSWHAAYTDTRRRQSHKLPMLMLPTERDRDEKTCSLYSLTEKRLCDFQVQVPHDLYCPGSCYGWLVTVSKDEKVSLLNPFMPINNKIDLPPVRAFNLHDWPVSPYDFCFLTKVVLSANPAVNPNYVVVAMYAISELTFFKPGDKKWTAIDIRKSIEDFIYYRDQVYTIERGQVFSYDLNHIPPRKSKLEVPAPPHTSRVHGYLVEVSGDLWQVLKVSAYENEDPFCSHTGWFDVYKLDFVGLKWIKMDSLHGHIVFLGNSSSFSVLASDFPECKPDSIYFTDDFYRTYREKEGHDPHDMGVFNIKDGTLEKYYPTRNKLIFPVPIWIEPQMS